MLNLEGGLLLIDLPKGFLLLLRAVFLLLLPKERFLLLSANTLMVV